MLRGPICREINPAYFRTPGPTGYNDSADPFNPVLEIGPRIPLQIKPLSQKKKKSSGGKSSNADAVAKLKKLLKQ